MAQFQTLSDYRGWSVVWHPTSHKLFVRTGGLFGSVHDFWERPHDRVTAIDIAKAWIDRR